jgi:hypothetical protein
MVAITSAGALVRLNPSTGSVEQVLRTHGVLGGEVSVSPSGATVYFAVDRGCDGEIWRIGIKGTDPIELAPRGSLPVVSPSGAKLAFTVQPLSYEGSCIPTGRYNGAGTLSVDVLDLATGAVAVHPSAPAYVKSGLPAPISYLSWSPSSSELAVSMPGIEDGEGQNVQFMSAARGSYYSSPSNAQLPIPSGINYFAGATYLPSGNLLIANACCVGVDRNQSSWATIEEVRPSGALLRDVEVHQTGGHSSLGVAAGGRYLFFLGGSTLYVGKNGERPSVLGSGYDAVAAAG